ncbi:FtsX-like permease family protein [Actinotalea sp. C106]|uniref:FtsX-like permease family protein n=1 Tax=Actinotalea sp. C106 TaxID=2908644 RepID=UPI0020285532|nr:FtsX-like permease family protein [Actinotalea sp. C106]
MRAVLALAPGLHRAGGKDTQLTTALGVAAFAVTTALTLSVVGGLLGFVGREAQPQTAYQAEWSDIYVILAWTAVVLLGVPLLSLGGAAARLGVARRDARLATLRLLGVTPREVVGLTLVETSGQGLVGAALGVLLYGLMLPLWALVPFQGSSFTVGELWVGWTVVLVALLAVPLLAAVSGAVSLRRVVLSPLGVARRERPKKLSVVRLLVAVVGVGTFMVISTALGAFGAAAFAFLVGGLALAFAALNVVGPWVLGLLARIQLRRASTPARLLAARRLLDDPRAAWRVVGGLGLAGFVAGALAIVPSLAASSTDDPDQQLLLTDLSTGALLTLVIAFVLAAVSAGVAQAASVLDRRREYALQHLAGVPAELLDEVRRREVLGPLLLVTVGSTAASVLMFAPWLGLTGVSSPGGMVMLAVCLTGGLLLVVGAVESTRPLLRSVLRDPVVRAD